MVCVLEADSPTWWGLKAKLGCPEQDAQFSSDERIFTPTAHEASERGYCSRPENLTRGQSPFRVSTGLDLEPTLPLPPKGPGSGPTGF